MHTYIYSYKLNTRIFYTYARKQSDLKLLVMSVIHTLVYSIKHVVFSIALQSDHQMIVADQREHHRLHSLVAQ